MRVYASIERARSCLRTIGDSKIVQIQRSDLQALLIAINNYKRTMAVIDQEPVHPDQAPTFNGIALSDLQQGGSGAAGWHPGDDA